MLYIRVTTQCVWSTVLISSTEACRDSSIPSYIGWMFLSDHVQARSHGVQLPARSSASVPRGVVPTNRRCRITATSSIRHSTAPGRTASPAQLLWPTGFLCGWSVGLEFPAGQLAESDYWREQFQTISEDVSVRNVLMHSSH